MGEYKEIRITNLKKLTTLELEKMRIICKEELEKNKDNKTLKDNLEKIEKEKQARVREIIVAIFNESGNKLSEELREKIKAEVIKQTIYFNEEKFYLYFYDFKFKGYWISSKYISNDETNIQIVLTKAV